jgi:hypothetical protein
MKPRVPASKYKQFIEFVEFLKANEALCYFNFICRDVFNHLNERWWITDAFIWDECCEDDGLFWIKVDNLWQDKLQREQNR